ARLSGDLAALRDAIDRALDAASPAPTDPRELGAPDLPRIADADPTQEELRLRALLRRPR
uniref:hypothetical protein n=1 Tax=Falsiroseomonas oryzae TaxID=2766473 RepID=UPI0022EB17B5